jgi:small subunit ribosomal protein S21
MAVSIIMVDCSKQDINKALKEFKRKVIKSGHILELKERKEYTKPTAINREKIQKAIRKQQREVILDKIAAGKLPQSALPGKKKKIKKGLSNTGE